MKYDETTAALNRANSNEWVVRRCWADVHNLRLANSGLGHRNPLSMTLCLS